MRNRAKCKKCGDVIESHNAKDQVDCSCEEISVFGGEEKMGCMARDWDNFVRVDDDDNEIEVKVVGKEPPTKQEMMGLLAEMIEKIEGLPPAGMSTAANQYDLLSIMYWLQAMHSLDKTDSKKKAKKASSRKS